MVDQVDTTKKASASNPLNDFMVSVGLTQPASIAPIITDTFDVREATKPEERIPDEERFASSLAAIVYNLEPQDKFDKQTIQELIKKIDSLIEAQVNDVIHHPSFQQLEATWRSIADLDSEVNYGKNIDVNLLDVSKEELTADFQMNGADVAGTELFKKIYLAEYDQFGGLPYGAMIGLYDFENTNEDIDWLESIGKIARAAHAPFIASASPKFFQRESFADVNRLRDIAGMMAHPRYGAWNKFREKDVAGYIGLVLPRYLVRAPWDLEARRNRLKFTEKFGHLEREEDYQKALQTAKPASLSSGQGAGNVPAKVEPHEAWDPYVEGEKADEYLWGSAAMLLARNLARSFEESSWCQYLRGVRGGGLVSGLPTHSYLLRGEELLRAPTEISMPDYRELELANAGFIPLIHRKGTADAVFFSVQSAKVAKEFVDPKDSETSQLTTNLSYTFSISRIAHYLKCMMRDNIGSSANAAYIQAQIEAWVSRYVTTVVNPDDLTLRYFPFKAYSLEVSEVVGKVGWYQCNLSVLPHIQFEGMNVDLRVDARLGSN